MDKNVLSILKEAPHSLFYLAHEVGIDADALGLQQLVNLGLISRIAMTPTDILHVVGKYKEWDTALAFAGTQIMAERMGKSVDDFVNAAMKAVVDRLCFICLQSLAGFENNQFDFSSEEAAKYLIEKAFDLEKQCLFSTSFAINKPIVAVGAPAPAWLGAVAKKTNTRLVIPKHAEVAGAIGAAVGQVMESVKVLIRPGEGGHGYILHAPWERRLFDDLATALDFGVVEAQRQAALAVQKAGGRDCEIVVDHEDIFTENFTSGAKVYVETRIEAKATGRPVWVITHA